LNGFPHHFYFLNFYYFSPIFLYSQQLYKNKHTWLAFE